MAGGRSAFTQEEDECLIKYIAKYNPQIAGRQGNRLYMTLVENPAKWRWARAHPWQSWRERYKKNQVEFDQKIRRYMRQKAAAAQPGKPEAIPSKARRENDAVDRRPIVDSSTVHAPSKEKGKQRAVDEEEGQHAGGSRRIPPVEAATPAEDTESAVESSEDDQEQFGSYVSGRRMFTQEEDEYLIKYIAKYNPQIAGRQGKRLYMTLVENPAKWRWARAHPWQSWRERYRRNQVEFDQKSRDIWSRRPPPLLRKSFRAKRRPHRPRQGAKTTPQIEDQSSTLLLFTLRARRKANKGQWMKM
ncbi:hypothetical protein BJ912DRAFT_87236 [Pholiota molesta]|nr:hypothetical protein BJ912DRAFT_87236 [Pholiota molesta]